MRISYALLALLLFAGVASAYYCEAGSEGTIAWYSLNESGYGNLIEVCGTGQDTPEPVGTTQVAAWYDNGQDFEESDVPADYINLGNNFGQNAFYGNNTFHAWVKAESDTVANNMIIGSGDGSNPATGIHMRRVNTDDKLYCTWYHTGAALATVTSSGTMAVGSWYFVACMVNNTHYCAYLNGTFDCTAGAITPQPNANYNYSIGKLGTLTHASFKQDGIIDEVGMWNRSLTADELAAIMANNTLAPAAGPVDYYGITANTYTTPVYETTQQDYNFSFWYNTTEITAVTAILQLNATSYSYTSNATNLTGDNASVWFQYDDFTIPLLDTNNSFYNVNWTYAITWANATTHNQSNNGTQFVHFAYYLNNTTAYPSQFLPMEYSFDGAGYLQKFVDNAAYWVSLFFNSTTGAATNNTLYNYTADFTTPYISSNNASLTLEGNFIVSFGGINKTRAAATNATLTIYRASLTDCSGALTTTPTLNVTFYDEVALTWTNETFEGTFWVWADAGLSGNNSTYSLNITNSSFEICLYPPNATLYVDSFSDYWNSTYTDVRAYFLDNATLTSTIEYLELYNLNNSLTKLIELTLKDESGQPLDNAYIYFQRYYPAENIYRTIAMVKTDDFGLGNTYLVPNDVWYRIVVTQGRTQLASFNPQTIPCDTGATACALLLDISPAELVEYPRYWDEVAYSCTFNATGTNATTCTITDTTGLMKYSRLKVWRNALFSPEVICDTNASTASATLTCAMGDVSGLYTYALSAHFADEIPLIQENIEWGNAALFGAEGLLLGFLLFIVVGFSGLFSPAAAVIMGSVGLLLGYASGVFNIAFSGVVAFCIVAVILAIKLKQ